MHLRGQTAKLQDIQSYKYEIINNPLIQTTSNTRAIRDIEVSELIAND